MKKLFLILGVIAMFAISCNKKEDLTIAVTMEGDVYSNEGNVPLSGVVVALNARGESYSASTDSKGHYKFDDVVPGTYVLRFSKAGYGVVVEEVDALESLFSGDAYSINTKTTLYKFDQTLKTKIVNSLGGVYKAASNVPLIIWLDDKYLNNKIEIMTDENGEIEVDSLPDEVISLEIDYQDEDYKYYFTEGYYVTTTISSYPSEYTELYILSRSTLSDYFYLEATNIVDTAGEEVIDFLATSNIEFTFSAPVDIEDYNIYLDKSYYKDDVAFDVSFQNNNKSLVINPLGNSLDEDASYRLSMYIYSEDGMYLSRSFNFSTGGEGEQEITLAKVTNIAITYPTTIVATTYYVEIEFPSIEDAYNYEVFGQYGTNEFLLLTTIYDYGNETISSYIYLNNLQGLEVPEDGLFANAATYSLVIRAKSSRNETGPFSDEFVISATK